MPVGETTRRMTIARMSTGGLVVFSAISLDDFEMTKIDALGSVDYLIVPSSIHRMDIKGWKTRYPHALVVAPEGAKKEVEELVPVDLTHVELFDPKVCVDVVPGTGEQEFSMLVETDTGKTLVVNDLIFNLPKVPGIAGIGLKLLGFAPGQAKQPKIVRMKLVDDDDAMRAQLRAWAEMAGLERILVSHGTPIENPRETLLALAAA